MKGVWVILAVAAAAAATAGEGEARAKFLDGWRDRFARSEVVPADTVAPENDFERAKGEAKWLFVLPFDEDRRVRFLEGTVKNGKFTKGVLHTFGFKEEKITTMRFNKLRKDFPMAVRRAGGVKSVKRNGKTLPPQIALHPPLTRPVRYAAPAHPDQLHLDPCGRSLGFLRQGLGSVGADLSKLQYEVVLENPRGLNVVLGVGTAAKGIHEKTSVAAIRKAIETKWPERAGGVSDRDVVEFYAQSTVVLRGVPSR